MARALLIAEKPDLMRKVKDVYDKINFKDEIDFVSFRGHVMTLVEPHIYNSDWEKWNLETLPMIPEKFKYTPNKSTYNLYSEAKKKIETGKYDYLINCCDPEREGQHIFFSFYETIGCKLPVKRFWSNDLTFDVVKKALENLRDEKEPALVNMTKASKLRAYFDWLIGMNFTRAFSLKGGVKSNIGRVMTPTLKILVDRELEIANFIPKDFWEVEGDFGSYKGIYFNEEGETQLLNKADADKIISSLAKQAEVVSVEEKKNTRYAPSLHSLSLLQNEANDAFGYTMSETLSIAQSLYEKQLLSYPRTDSCHITTTLSKQFKKMLQPLLLIDEIKDAVEKVLNDNSILESTGKNKSYVDDKKVSDHYAITPTGAKPDLSKLSDKEINIYTLVAKRFLSIFLPPMISMKTTIVTDNNGYKFKSNGSVLVDEGFTAIYSIKTSDTILPKVKKGEKVQCIGGKLLTKKTKPPARYVDKTLNTALENAGRFVDDAEMKEILKQSKGIGTPATRGDIVEKLTILKMVERRKKAFYVLDYGMSVIKNLGNHEIVSPELTAKWEQKLSEIEECRYDAGVFYKEMIEYIKNATENLKNMNISLPSTNGKAIGSCPKCGSSFLEGKDYYRCSKYSKGDNAECNFIVPKNLWGAKISATEMTKILKGKETKEYSFKMVKNGEEKSWNAKLIYDKEKGKISFAGSGGGNSKEALCKCPVCGAGVKEGKDYYLCENYKKTCNLIIPKVYSGSSITKADVKALLQGKETGEKEFTWKSGKSGKAKLKYTTKLEYVFPSR